MTICLFLQTSSAFSHCTSSFSLSLHNPLPYTITVANKWNEGKKTDMKCNKMGEKGNMYSQKGAKG